MNSKTWTASLWVNQQYCKPTNGNKLSRHINYLLQTYNVDQKHIFIGPRRRCKLSARKKQFCHKTTLWEGGHILHTLGQLQSVRKIQVIMPIIKWREERMCGHHKEIRKTKQTTPTGRRQTAHRTGTIKQAGEEASISANLKHAPCPPWYSVTALVPECSSLLQECENDSWNASLQMRPRFPRMEHRLRNDGHDCLHNLWHLEGLCRLQSYFLLLFTLRFRPRILCLSSMSYTKNNVSKITFILKLGVPVMCNGMLRVRKYVHPVI